MGVVQLGVCCKLDLKAGLDDVAAKVWRVALPSRF
jgi:hypothetical protein